MHRLVVRYKAGVSSPIVSGDGFAEVGDVVDVRQGSRQFVWNLKPGGFVVAVLTHYVKRIRCGLDEGSNSLTHGGEKIFVAGKFTEPDALDANGTYIATSLVAKSAAPGTCAQAEPSPTRKTRPPHLRGLFCTCDSHDVTLGQRTPALLVPTWITKYAPTV